jgi:hypothetical protein
MRAIACVRTSTACCQGGANVDPRCGPREQWSRNEKEKEQASQAGGRPMLQIKTSIDFGEDGIPLERLGEITSLLKARQLASCPR